VNENGRRSGITTGGGGGKVGRTGEGSELEERGPADCGGSDRGSGVGQSGALGGGTVGGIAVVEGQGTDDKVQIIVVRLGHRRRWIAGRRNSRFSEPAEVW
jgi:hypothetical protein